MRLPIDPRLGVPFDVDLGPDGHGNVVAAYSRCQVEPDVITVRDTFVARVFSRPYPAYTAGRGCDIYRFDFDTLTESKLAGASTDGASEMLPSIWKDQVAFARVYEQRDGLRGRVPYLYVRPLAGGRSERQPGGSRGSNGLPGPTRLDLYGRRLSFVWNHSTREASQGGVAGVSELRLDTVGGALGQGEWGANQPYASFVGPQGDQGRIYYGYQRAEQQEGADRSIASLLLRYRITTNDKELTGVPSFLIDASTDAAQTYIATNADNFSYGPGQIQRNPTVWGASDKPQIASVQYGKHRPPGAERSFYGLKVRARDPDGQIVSIDVAPIDASSTAPVQHADGACGLGGKTTGETETWYLPTGRLQAGTHRYRVTVQSSSCDAANQLQSTTETFSVHP